MRWDLKGVVSACVTHKKKPPQEDAESVHLWERKRTLEKGENMLPRQVTEADIAAFDEEFKTDLAAFLHWLPEMLKEYRGEFVAIHHGNIIEYQADWETLARAMQARFPHQFVFIKKVAPESEETICMGTIKG